MTNDKPIPQPGTRVLLSGVAHLDYNGKVGIIRKYIKSRNVLEVMVPNKGIYDAYPQNIKIVGEP